MKSEKNYKIKFLEKAMLGQKADFDVSEKVIDRCIELAYKDMLTAGRFYIQYAPGKSYEKNERIREKYREYLNECEYVFSEGLIKKTASLFREKDNKKIIDGKLV